MPVVLSKVQADIRNTTRQLQDDINQLSKLISSSASQQKIFRVNDSIQDGISRLGLLIDLTQTAGSERSLIPMKKIPIPEEYFSLEDVLHTIYEAAAFLPWSLTYHDDATKDYAEIKIWNENLVIRRSEWSVWRNKDLVDHGTCCLLKEWEMASSSGALKKWVDRLHEIYLPSAKNQRRTYETPYAEAKALLKTARPSNISYVVSKLERVLDRMNS